MRGHGADPPWDQGFAVVGQPRPKVDGPDKATGTALYADDIVLPGMLHGKTLRSPHPHARIVAIDTSRAAALPGVHAVITGADLPTRYGIIPWTEDETALATDTVRFVGDEVAALAAVDEDTANAALRLIDVRYEPLHAFLSPREALARDQPKIHQGSKRGNISKQVELEFGDVDTALATAELTVAGEYSFHGSTHAAIEPHCALARYGADERLTLWSSTQITH